MVLTRTSAKKLEATKRNMKGSMIDLCRLQTIQTVRKLNYKNPDQQKKTWTNDRKVAWTMSRKLLTKSCIRLLKTVQFVTIYGRPGVHQWMVVDRKEEEEENEEQQCTGAKHTSRLVQQTLFKRRFYSFEYTYCRQGFATLEKYWTKSVGLRGDHLKKFQVL